MSAGPFRKSLERASVAMSAVFLADPPFRSHLNMPYLDSIARGGTAYVPLLLRVTLGALFIAHLYWKVAVYPGGLDRWWSNFATNGYPWFVPWYVVSAELAGALLLIPGIAVRWVSLYAMPMMIGAAHFWAIRNGFWFVAGGAELPVLWAVLLVLQFLLGSGPYALKAGRGVSA